MTSAEGAIEDEYPWEQCDSSDGPETLVLLGAGASADLGLPTALDLHQRLIMRLSPLYSNLATMVFGGSSVDVERLFRVIEFIHSIETLNRPADQRSVYAESVDIAQLVKQWGDGLSDYFVAQNATVQGSPSGRLIDELYSALGELLWIQPDARPDCRYLAWLLKSMKGGTIVTLNYDNSLEYTASNVGAYIPTDFGISPVDRTKEIPGQPHRGDAVRVIKLHGSLDWTTDAETGTVSQLDQKALTMQRHIREKGGTRPQAPGIIFGAGNKLRPEGPYLDLYIEFKERLANARRLIVIGYGWRDAHVNELIRRWVVYGPKNRLLRLSRINQRDFPWKVKTWATDIPSFQIDAVDGRIRQTIRRLMLATPELLRDKRPTAKERV